MTRGGASSVRRGAWTVLLALGAGLSLSFPVAAAPLYGVPYLSYPAGRGPVDLAVADFTGDGVFDLITANFLAGTLTLSTGLPDGQFRPALVVAEVAAPTSVLASDVDFDGDMDVLVTSYDPGSIVVFANDDAGHFLVRQVLEAPGGPVAALLSDVTFDFGRDLVVANFLNGTLSIFPGTSGGLFSEFPTGLRVGVQPIAVVSGDLNGDGLADLVTANYGSADVSLLPADPAGFFRPYQPYPLAQRPLDLVGGDMNGDGRLDLVVGFDSQGSVASLRSDQGFSFENQTAYPTGGTRVSRLRLADLNGDRIQDLVVLDDESAGFRVLRGLGNGGFAAGLLNPGGQGPTAAAAADFNEDGVLDLAATSLEPSQVGIHLGRGDGRFGVEHRLDAPAKPLLLSGDLDGNGLADLVLLGTDPAAPGAAVRLSAGRSNLVARPVLDGLGPVEAAALTDLDDDARLDLALVDAVARQLRLFRGNGLGSFTAIADLPLSDRAAALLARDLSGDGRVDLAVALEDQDRVALFLGDARAPSGFRAVAPLAVGDGPRALAAADFDGDGARDLVVAHRSGRGIVVFAGGGSGPGGPARPVLDGVVPAALETADLDRDGRPDLLVALEDPAELRLLRAGAAFEFEALGIGGVGAGVADLDLADLNGDGLEDYLMGCTASGVVTTWLATGDVRLRTRADFGVGAGGGGVSVAALGRGAGEFPLLVVSDGRPGGGVLTLASGESLTPIELLEFSAARTRGGIRLVGRVAGDWRGGWIGIHRLDEGGMGRVVCRTTATPEGRFGCEDLDPAPGSARYALEIAFPGGALHHFPPIDLAPPGPPEAALSATPNPFRTALELAWTPAPGGPVTLEVFDAAGRRVARFDPDPAAAARGRLAWDGRGSDGRPLASGLYWLRLMVAGRSGTRRVLRLP